MTVFTSWEFLTNGATEPRTLPDRLAEIKNVKDFGATGDGVTDDLDAIQAAYDWTVATNRGALYFPPGTYYVSGPIDISTISSQVRLVGVMGLSTIVGNFADYIIKRYQLSSGGGGNQGVEKLTIINQHALGGGIRLGFSVGCAIRDCDITANFCINTDNSDVFGPPGDPGAYWFSLEVSISNCNLRPYSALAASSTGIARGANGSTTNCTFRDFDAAIRTYGGQGGMTFSGCYFEANNFAFANATGPGTATVGGTNGTGGVNVFGCHFKNNGIAIAYVSGISRYAGILIEATEGTIAGDPQYGIYVGSGGSCAFEGITITGQYEQAGFYMAGGDAAVSPSWVAGVGVTNTSTLGGVDWELPSTAMTMDIEECNVASVWTMAEIPARTHTITAATWSGGTATITVTGAGDLPTGNLGNVSITGVTPSGYNGLFENVNVPQFNQFTYPVANPGGAGTVFGEVFFTTVANGRQNAYEGYCYNVSNADTATWGAAAKATGSNHVKLRYTPTAWTVVGK